MATSIPSSLLLSVLLLLPSLASASCYNPDGSALTTTTENQPDNAIWQPCNQVQGTYSSCCITNRTSDVSKVAEDTCLANGLCSNFYTWPNASTTVLYWAPLCSDPTWKSPDCLPDVCSGVNWTAAANRPSLANCSNDMWCCNPDSDQSCCNDPSKTFKLAAVIGQSTSSTASPTSSPTNAGPTGSTTPTSPASGGISTGGIVGIVIGVVAFLILLAIAGFVFWRRSSSGRRQGQAPRTDPYVADMSGKSHAPNELDGSSVPVEIDGTHVAGWGPAQWTRSELDASQGNSLSGR